MPGELPPVIPEDSVPDTPPAPASRLSLNLGAMAAGEFQPAQGEGFDFLTTARAQNEVAITVRGDSKMKARRIMHLQPTMLGKGKVKAAWRPNSTQLAVAVVARSSHEWLGSSPLMIAKTSVSFPGPAFRWLRASLIFARRGACMTRLSPS